jgi:hypothetical protein
MERESEMDSRYLEAVVIGIITALVAGFFGIGADRAAPTDHPGTSLIGTEWSAPVVTDDMTEGRRNETQVRASFAL